jgi:Ca2+-binding EF-hand superfamily protein
MAVLVQQLKLEDLSELKEIFLALDIDKSGTITMEELQTALERIGVHAAKE